MKRKELQDLAIIRDGIQFSPKYTFTKYNQERDEYEGIIIVKTAEEVYRQYLAQKQTNPYTIPTDQERITKLEEEKSILAENVYQLASIIEAMLGGE